MYQTVLFILVKTLKRHADRIPKPSSSLSKRPPPHPRWRNIWLRLCYSFNVKLYFIFNVLYYFRAVLVDDLLYCDCLICLGGSLLVPCCILIGLLFQGGVYWWLPVYWLACYLREEFIGDILYSDWFSFSGMFLIGDLLYSNWVVNGVVCWWLYTVFWVVCYFREEFVYDSLCFDWLLYIFKGGVYQWLTVYSDSCCNFRAVRFRLQGQSLWAVGCSVSSRRFL